MPASAGNRLLDKDLVVDATVSQSSSAVSSLETLPCPAVASLFRGKPVVAVVEQTWSMVFFPPPTFTDGKVGVRA